MSIIIPLRGMENHTTGLRPWKCTPIPLRGLPPKGETTHYILCVASLLQNVFAVHPEGGSFSGAMLCDAYEFIGSLRVVVPPHSGGKVVP